MAKTKASVATKGAPMRRVTALARVQAISGLQGRSLQRMRRFKTRIPQRKVLTFYARYGSIAERASRREWHHIFSDGEVVSGNGQGGEGSVVRVKTPERYR